MLLITRIYIRFWKRRHRSIPLCRKQARTYAIDGQMLVRPPAIPAAPDAATALVHFAERNVIKCRKQITRLDARERLRDLLFLNKVIPEDEVLDKQSLPKVKMPIGDDYAK